MGIKFAHARVPWRVKKSVADLASAACYCRNVLAAAPPSGKIRLLFYVPPYGFTGASYAVISTANLLSQVFDVAFLTHPTNIMNRYVGRHVRMVREVQGRYDACITEPGLCATDLAKLRQDNAVLVMTMHGAPDLPDGTRNHGHADEAVIQMMRLVDSVQIISDAQLPLDEPGVAHCKIPNFVPQIKKQRRGRVAGIVCDTTLPHKNAQLGVAMAARSRAERVEVWGRHHHQRSTARVRWNGFHPDRARIYDSFDVLVHLSSLENQPLVILDALSAGTPCVLADLAVYAPFRGLDGIWFVDPNDPDATVAAIDAALDCSAEARDGLIRFWRDNHSPEIILQTWTDYLTGLHGQRRVV